MKPPGLLVREALLGTAIGLGFGPQSAFTEATEAYVGALYGQPDAEAETVARAQAEVAAPPRLVFIPISREVRRTLKHDNEPGGVWLPDDEYLINRQHEEINTIVSGIREVRQQRHRWRQA